MANVLKYKTSQPTKRALRKGNVVLGIGEENYGPSSTTGYYSGIDVPEDGYVVYTLGANNNPKVFVSPNDEGLIDIARTLGGGILDVLGSKNYLQTRANTWMLGNVPDNKVTDGLIANINSQNKTSFIDNIPTENLFGTTAMSFQDDAGVYTNNIISGTDSIGDYFIKDVNNAPWWSGLRIYQNGVFPLTAGVSYVLSFECRSGQTGWSWAYDSNASGGGWSGNDQGRLSNTNLVFDKTGGTVYTSDMANTWQRVSYRVTMKDASVFTGASAYPHDSFFTNTNNVQIYYRNPQLEIDRTTASSYTSGTRSQNTTVYDLSGVGNNGTLQNGTIFNNGVWELDGVNDRVDIADPGYPSSGTDPFSIEILFKVPTGATWYNQGSGTGIIGRGSYAGSLGIFRGGTEGYVSFWARLNGGNIYDPTVTGITRDKWHRIVGTFDGVDTAKIFHNGTYITQEVDSNNAGTFDAGAYLIGGGTSFGGNNGGYGGVHVTSAKIYNKALSTNEVSQNYYGGPIVTDGLVFVMDAGDLVSYESGSTTVYDMVGSINGTLTNGVGYSNNYGGGFVFDGSNDFIQADGNLLNVDAFTVEAVVNITSDGNYNKTILYVGNASTTGIWFLKHRSGLGNRLVMHGYDGVNPRIDVQSTDVVPDAENVYVAVTFDGTKYQLYINGVENGPSVTDNKIAASTSNDIGRIGSTYMAGTIYTLRAYNKALSDEEVLQNFNAQKARFGL